MGRVFEMWFFKRPSLIGSLLLTAYKTSNQLRKMRRMFALEPSSLIGVVQFERSSR